LNGKQLIDNLVGNWLPNQSGTYSPFGGSSNVTPVPHIPPEIKEIEQVPKKKPRMVAEVKPMRPSYSDVLIKSIPTPPSPLTTALLKPKPENASKKIISKNSKNKVKPTVLKRQNSSGSDEHGSPKIQLPKKTSEKINTNLSRRWVSLDNLGLPTESPDLIFDRSDNFDKKKNFKTSKKTDKGETLNNSKIQNNSTKNTSNLQKRPIQINNNLNTTSSFSQTVYTDKIEKNQQVNNKIKEDKKLTKEKSSKHFQAEKAQQIKKCQRNRKRETKDTAFKDLYKTAHKYFNRWSKIGLKIFFWFLHLISDIISMSANLVIQL
jgi:DnaJ family protein C protein 14